ncbi:MAG TPA: hypothetical protein VJV78_07770, partial [Polyangiales bacterium]|nr:hypothetical protein [Polyangiales bacterium]
MTKSFTSSVVLSFALCLFGCGEDEKPASSPSLGISGNGVVGSPTGNAAGAGNGAVGGRGGADGAAP